MTKAVKLTDRERTDRGFRSWQTPVTVAQFRRNSLFSFTTSGAEVITVIFTLIETAKANQADPYYYLKYLLEQMPSHLYDQKASAYMPDLIPWSHRYRCYEIEEKENLVMAQAPPGNEKPRTPRKRDKDIHSA